MSFFKRFVCAFCAAIIAFCFLSVNFAALAEDPAEEITPPVEEPVKSADFTVDTTRRDGERITLDLDGKWELYTTTVVLEALADNDIVLLEIPRAALGRKFFANGSEIWAAEDFDGLGAVTLNITDLIDEDGLLELSFEELDGDLEDGASLDGVDLIITGGIVTENVKTEYDLAEGLLTIEATVRNYTDEECALDLGVTVYELGTVVDGVSSTREGTGFVATKVTVPANETVTVSGISVALRNFDEAKYWSPSNPFLYEIELATGEDTQNLRVGMRRFAVEGEERSYPMLNGEAFFLSGVTVDFSGVALDEKSVREYMLGLRAKDMSVIKAQNGAFPEIWYDLADECGIMLIVGVEDLGLMQDLYNHPSVVAWDLLSFENIEDLREFDRQGRPFDCGYSAAPASKSDWIECDVSELGDIDIIQDGKYTAGVGGVIYYPEDISWDIKDYNNPRILTNYCTDKYTAAELTQLTEYLRIQRRFAGLLIPATVLSTAEGDAASSALGSVGLSIEYYETLLGRGDTAKFDVTVINDTTEDLNDLSVTLVLKSGDTVFYTETKPYDSVKKYGNESRDIFRREFELTVPAYISDNTNVTLEATLSCGGKTIYSSRVINITGGAPYESPFSTWIIVGIVGACVLIVSAATITAFGKVRRS